jgi:hypothetical protein
MAVNQSLKDLIDQFASQRQQVRMEAEVSFNAVIVRGIICMFMYYIFAAASGWEEQYAGPLHTARRRCSRCFQISCKLSCL